MMLIEVKRFTSDNDTTLGLLLIDGRFECFTVEDEYREVKVSAETRTPSGLYSMKARTVGGFHARYGRDYPDFHKGMLEICDVPEFTDILIHRGNFERDTAGCLLVNTGVFARPGEMSGQSSDSAYRAFYPKVIDSAIKGELLINIIDGDMAYTQ